MQLKKIIRKIVEKYLAFLVKIKLARTQPVVIGITGSFGKTSTKEAIYQVLRTKMKVYRSQKSFNTEIGLLLSVLEQPSGFSSPITWAHVLTLAIINALWGQKYHVLVLEYGADKPGDIANLIFCVKPHIAVITHIARVHQGEGQFKDEYEVFKEKKKLATCLDSTDFAVLNKADPFLQQLSGNLSAHILWWNGKSHDEDADISSNSLKIDKKGFSAQIFVKRDLKEVPIHAHFPVLGTYHINVFLPALLCGTLYGISIEEGTAALQYFRLPPGRMSVLVGINGSTILDSSYNASPHTVLEALRTLHDFPFTKGGRKIAVLGNMNELGTYGIQAAREVIQEIGHWLDMVITVGEYAKITADEALKKGFPASRIKILLTACEAANFLLKYGLRKEDVVLYKGSQNAVRLERTVKRLMAHPEEAEKLLCRQEKEWTKIE